MTRLERVRQTVCRVIDELNEQLPPGERLGTSPETVLVGAEGGLDSLGLVNLIALLEQRIEDDFQTSVSLIDDDLLSSASIHFASVGSTTDYLATVLRERVDE